MKIHKHFLPIFLASAAFASCSEKETTFEEPEEPFDPKTFHIQGKAEKGPFIIGSEVSIRPTDSHLNSFGSLFTTTVTDNAGKYTFGNKELTSPYAEFAANGYFFNEVTGNTSSSPITLRAVADLEDNANVNINVLTHLHYARAKRLLATGMKFDKANEQAQRELMEAFGLGTLSNKDATTFTYTEGTDEAAALIATSSLLLMERSEAALSEHLSKLSADFAGSGRFSDENLRLLANDKHSLAPKLATIKEHIIRRYDDLGTGINIRELTHFIDWDNDGTAGNEVLKDGQSVSIEKSQLEVPLQGGDYVVEIKSPIQLYLEPQIKNDTTEWDTPQSGINPDDLFKNLYKDDESKSKISYVCELKNNALNITVLPLKSGSGLSTSIPLYDYLGNIAASIEIIQGTKSDIMIDSTTPPLLGSDGEAVVANIAMSLSSALSQYNLIEQQYTYNPYTGWANNLHPSNTTISNAWQDFYKTVSTLLMLQEQDRKQRDVYADYINVFSAMTHSNLVYGWNDVPYFTDYTTLQNNAHDLQREPSENIFRDIKKKLSVAIGRLAEKKNESTKSINDLFFVSKDVARVLLANIHMYEGNYGEAKELLSKVEDNGFYTLDASTNFKPSGDVNIDATSAARTNIRVEESTEVIFALLGNDPDSRAGKEIILLNAPAIPYMTLSDVLLSLAECYYHEGDTTTAEAYIKSVADAKPISITESNTLMKIKEAREQIHLYSGMYFPFLKRTGLAKDVCGIEDYQLLFPIPYGVIIQCPSMTQNPGYENR